MLEWKSCDTYRGGGCVTYWERIANRSSGRVGQTIIGLSLISTFRNPSGFSASASPSLDTRELKGYSDLMSIGNSIREARIAKGWTQVVLAAKVGCTEQSIVAWEGGGRTPLGIYRERMEKVLGVKLEEEGDGQRKTNPS